MRILIAGATGAIGRSLVRRPEKQTNMRYSHLRDRPIPHPR